MNHVIFFLFLLLFSVGIFIILHKLFDVKKSSSKQIAVVMCVVIIFLYLFRDYWLYWFSANTRSLNFIKVLVSVMVPLTSVLGVVYKFVDKVKKPIIELENLMTDSIYYLDFSRVMIDKIFRERYQDEEEANLSYTPIDSFLNSTKGNISQFNTKGDIYIRLKNEESKNNYIEIEEKWSKYIKESSKELEDYKNTPKNNSEKSDKRLILISNLYTGFLTAYDFTKEQFELIMILEKTSLSKY